MKVKDCFNKDGSFRIPFDPYRISEDHPAIGIYNTLFEDGDLGWEASIEISRMVLSGEYPANSDIVKLMYADDFAMNTKGNYTAVYMWR